MRLFFANIRIFEGGGSDPSEWGAVSSEYTIAKVASISAVMSVFLYAFKWQLHAGQGGSVCSALSAIHL